MEAEWNPFSDDSSDTGHHSFFVLLCKFFRHPFELVSFNLCALEWHLVSFRTSFGLSPPAFNLLGKEVLLVLLFSCIWFGFCSLSLLSSPRLPHLGPKSRPHPPSWGVLVLFSVTYLSALLISLYVFSFVFSVSPQPKLLSLFLPVSAWRPPCSSHPT